MSDSARIQVDLWGGDLHQHLVKAHLVATWPEAHRIIEEAVEAGLLANVLHLDFKTPEDRRHEMDAALHAAIMEAGK